MLKHLLIAVAVAALAAPALAADQAPRPVTSYKAPRAADGRPSLDGVWTNVSLTRLERNARWGGELVLSEAKVGEIEGKNQRLLRLAARNTDANATVLDLPADCSDGRVTNCNYNAGWTDPGDTVMRVGGQPRNGYITSPADGRVPMRKGVQPAYGRALPRGLGPSDNPESRALGERCLLSFGNSSGPVMTPGLYNNMYQIVQTREAVLINVEMVHDARIVRLNTRQHLPATLRPWMGDSIGWWEGETLVVETTNYHPEQVFRGASANLKVTERFTPVSPTRLHYAFWVEDPSVFAQAWGGEYEFSRSKAQVFEYACHEGNYGLANILSGARIEDKTGVKTAPTNIDQHVAAGEDGEEGG